MSSLPNNLTEGSIKKTLFFFSIPILLGNVLQSINGTVNSIWVGKILGENAFAATSNANLVMFLLISSIFGISMAATILIGQHLGSRKVEEAKEIIGASFVLFSLLSFLTASIGYVFSKNILVWMNTPPEALDYAESYLQIVFIGMPFIYGYNFIMMIMRGAGNSKTPFIFLLFSTILDITLNPILMLGLLGLPKMGIAGSATAMILSQLISLTGLICFLYYSNYFLIFKKQDRKYIRWNTQIISSLFKKGIPMGMQMMVVSSSGIVLMNMVNEFGTMVTAAYSAVMQLYSYVQMPAMAIGGAVSSMAAQNIGAGKWNRVHQVTMTGVLYNFLMTGFLVLIIYGFNEKAVGLFLSDPATMRLAEHINWITLWSFIFFGIMMVVSGVVRSTGAVMVPLLMSFLSLWVIRIPLAYMEKGTYGHEAIWWSISISFMSATVLSILYYQFGKWKEANMMKKEA